MTHTHKRTHTHTHKRTHMAEHVWLSVRPSQINPTDKNEHCQKTDSHEIPLQSKSQSLQWLKFNVFLILFIVLDIVASWLKDRFLHHRTQDRERITDRVPRTIEKLLISDLIHLNTTLIPKMVAAYPLLTDYPCLSTENKIRNRCCNIS
jgi:hypothetical protein